MSRFLSYFIAKALALWPSTGKDASVCTRQGLAIRPARIFMLADSHEAESVAFGFSPDHPASFSRKMLSGIGERSEMAVFSPPGEKFSSQIIVGIVRLRDILGFCMAAGVIVAVTFFAHPGR